MKLLVISSAFAPFRAPESVHAQMLCEEIAKRGVEVHLLTTKRPPNDSCEKNFRVHRVMEAWDWKRLPYLLRFVRKLEPDAILLIYIDWIYSFHPMVALLPAFLRRLLPGTPFITQFENVSGLAGAEPSWSRSNRAAKRLATLLCAPRSLHRAYGALLRDSDKVIALSERHLDVFEEECPGVRAKTTVIPAPTLVSINSRNETELRAEGRRLLGVDDEALLLAYFGYVYTGKGVETLLRAFAELRSRLSILAKQPLNLVIIGWVSDPVLHETLVALQDELGLRDSVIWTGYVDSADRASTYLRAADIAVLPYDSGVRMNHSSFAICASHGLPIVTTRGGSVEPVFRDRQNVALCPAMNPRALADAVHRVASSSALRERIARGAAELAESVFSSRNVIDATIEVLESARRNRHHGRVAFVPAHGH